MKHRPARDGTHHLQTGLLQLSVSRVTQSTLNVSRTLHLGWFSRQSDRTTLAADPLANTI